MSSHRNRREEVSFPSFFLASQYRSHSVPLDNAVHRPRWFLSMVSWRLHSMQWGVGTDYNAVEMCSQAIMPNAKPKFCKLPFFLDSLVFWLILASIVFDIALSLIHVYTHFGTRVLRAV